MCIFEVKGKKEDDVEVEGETVAFQIEMGRCTWHGKKREERVCKECDSGEVEDVCHWLMQCSARDHLRQLLLEAMEHGGIKGGLSSKERWRESSPCIVTGL